VFVCCISKWFLASGVPLESGPSGTRIRDVLQFSAEHLSSPSGGLFENELECSG